MSNQIAHDFKTVLHWMAKAPLDELRLVAIFSGWLCAQIKAIPQDVYDTAGHDSRTKVVRFLFGWAP